MSRRCALRTSDEPDGIVAEIEGAEIRLTGLVEQPGTYTFTMVPSQREGRHEACAPWARYDVTLVVAPSNAGM